MEEQKFIKDKKKNKVGLMVIQKYFTGNSIDNNNRYINVSINNRNVRNALASVGLMVIRRSNKPGLHGHPGSNPGWGASLTFSNLIKQRFNFI